MPVPKVLRLLTYFAAATYFVVGLVAGLWPSHWDNASVSDQALWIGLMVGGSILVVVGLRLLPRSRWAGAVLLSIGAFFGALPIFWTGFALALAVALVLLSVRYARGRSNPLY
ncbi:MAG: hypothetical protein ABI896_07165 [Actinomycetota bacterium]